MTKDRQHHILLLLLLLLLPLHPSLWAQQTLETELVGTITDGESGETLPGVALAIVGTSQGTRTGADGSYRLRLSGSSATLRISYVGYEEQTVELRLTGGRQRHDFRLRPSAEMLQTLTVVGKSHAQRLREIPTSITVIDAKELQGRTITVEGILDRAMGVKVNRTGGLGSASRIIVQGMDGKRVGVFVNGLSVGTTEDFRVNAIPTDNIERIEVYKGLVPAWLGGDGIGGAINIILREEHHDHLSISHEVGSYTTHRSSLMGSYTIPGTGIHLSIDGAHDYARNDYSFVSPFEEGRVIRRDHDRYRSWHAGAGIAFSRLWLDALGLQLSHGSTYQEIQGGQLKIQNAVRHAHTRTEGLSASLMAEKTLADDRLHLTLQGILQSSTYHLVDTSQYRYDFDGNPFRSTSGLGEVGSGPNNSSDKYLHASALFNARYRATDALKVNLNTLYRLDRKDPSDPLSDSYLRYPVSGYPNRLSALILGLSYEWTFGGGACVNEGGLKYFHHHSEVYPDGNTFFQEEPKVTAQSSHNYGWSEALSWKPLDGITLKGSLQRTLRIPTQEELFGDAVLVLAAQDLRPELSHNANLGANILLGGGAYPNLTIDFNGYYMHMRDMIMLVSQGLQLRHFNIGRARTLGAELELSSELTPWCSLMVNGTYTDTRDRTPEAIGGGENYHYDYRVPNIPYLFGNAELNLHFRDLIGRGTELSLYSAGSFTERFSYDWEASSRNTLIIPRKWSLDAGIHASFRDRYHLTLEAHNILDKEQWAEFQYPLPGRTLHAKLRIIL